jgi:Nuclease-related domain
MVIDGRPQSSLASRVPGEAVIGELLRLQADGQPRSKAARLFGRSPLAADSVPWYADAVGEREVGRLLGFLGGSWTVLHSVPFDSASRDIDHLAIGPGGVFAINTKNHADRHLVVDGANFIVSGHRYPYIRKAEYEARQVTIALAGVLPLGFAVTPVIAVVAPARLTVREMPSSVRVVDARQLADWLQARPATLDASRVEQLATVAALPETWLALASGQPDATSGIVATPVTSTPGTSTPIASNPTASAATDSNTVRDVPEDAPNASSLIAAFGSLEGEVRVARRRQVAWTVGGIIAASGAFAVVAPTLIHVVASAVFRGL